MLDYIVLPVEVFVELRSHPRALSVLICLMYNLNIVTGRTRFMSKRLIAKKSGISRRYIYTVLDKLELLGFIKCIAEAKRRIHV